MTHQQSINKSIKSARSKDNLNSDTLDDFEKRLEGLKIPSYKNVNFDPVEWDRFIRDITDVECLALRNHFDDDSDEYRILSAIAAHRSNNQEYVEDAIDISIRGNPSERLCKNIPKIISEIIFRVPISTILASWVSEVYICDDEEYEKIVGKKSKGYYDPNDHWIAIRHDITQPNSEYWSVSYKKPRDTYETSVTIHEFGHAFHYMFGLQTKNPDTRDNREKNIEDANFSLRKEVSRGKQQSKFCIDCSKAYGLILDNTYDTLTWNDRLKINIEEFMAECFVVYVTSPRYLAKKQPLVFSIFNNLTNI